MTEPALQDEMSALFSGLLVPEAALRFTKLLAMKPGHWAKIDPWRVWSDEGLSGSPELKAPIAELLGSPPLARFAATEVTVLRCGHDRPQLCRLLLAAALTGNHAVFEGFISIVPGQLGMALNHDGMFMLWTKPIKRQL